MHFSAVQAIDYVDIIWRSAARGLQTKEGWENKPFSGFKRQYLENGSRHGQSYY